MKHPFGLSDQLKTDVLTEVDARNICSWRYPPPYDVYDYADWETVVRSGWDLSLPEKRGAEYVGFKLDNELVAFGRICNIKDYILLGIGLRPDYCSRGLGASAMRLLIAAAELRYPGRAIALEVRTFNLRAIRCYEHVGFRRVKTYVRNTLTGEEPFYFMRYSARQRGRV